MSVLLLAANNFIETGCNDNKNCIESLNREQTVQLLEKKISCKYADEFTKKFVQEYNDKLSDESNDEHSVAYNFYVANEKQFMKSIIFHSYWSTDPFYAINANVEAAALNATTNVKKQLIGLNMLRFPESYYTENKNMINNAYRIASEFWTIDTINEGIELFTICNKMCYGDISESIEKIYDLFGDSFVFDLKETIRQQGAEYVDRRKQMEENDKLELEKRQKERDVKAEEMRSERDHLKKTNPDLYEKKYPMTAVELLQQSLSQTKEKIEIESLKRQFGKKMRDEKIQALVDIVERLDKSELEKYNSVFNDDRYTKSDEFLKLQEKSNNFNETCSKLKNQAKYSATYSNTLITKLDLLSTQLSTNLFAEPVIKFEPDQPESVN
jgi:hypothetical protein